MLSGEKRAPETAESSIPAHVSRDFCHPLIPCGRSRGIPGSMHAPAISRVSHPPSSGRTPPVAHK